MSKVSKPRGSIVAALAIIGIAMSYNVSALADGPDDQLLRTAGEFQLGNAESKVIADHSSPEPYRVCVTKSPDAVPVMARYDGQERSISVGDCDELTAKVITLSPAAKLHGDVVLLGKYEHLRR